MSFLPTKIQSISDLGYFKGAIGGLVHVKLHHQVVVIDCGCADVAIVCQKDFIDSSNHTNLMNALTDNSFQLNVIAEYIADQEQIAAIWAFSERRGGLNTCPIINKDNRNIVVYDEIVQKAVALSATDIHFEVREGALSRVRLRIDSRLHAWKSFPTQFLKDALTAAYSARNKSGTNSSGTLAFERAANTVTENKVLGKDINGRFSGYPLVNGYDVVMRLLDSDPNSVIPSIETLGYSDSHVTSQLLPALHRNQGMVAIGGSTGSGKSTALRSMIYSIPGRDNLKIYSVEDPVEYLCNFMSQISVQRNSDDPPDVVSLKFASALVTVLRMDPDVVMIGEIRDKVSASLAANAAASGHRIFTSIHGNSCIAVLMRMVSKELGMYPNMLADKEILSAVMYQKLIPKLCPHCKVPATSVLPQATLSLLTQRYKLDPGTMYCANEAGCVHCKIEEVSIAGKKGMTVVAEILTPNNDIRVAIKSENWLEVERCWRSCRTASFDDPDMTGKTAFEHALYKASIGMIDPQDIEADFESFSSYQLFEDMADALEA